MLLFFLAVCGAAAGQDAGGQPSAPLTGEVTVVGRDETAIPIPAPWTQAEVVIPDLEPLLPVATFLPPIEPPAEDWPTPWIDPRVLDPLKDLPL